MTQTQTVTDTGRRSTPDRRSGDERRSKPKAAPKAATKAAPKAKAAPKTEGAAQRGFAGKTTGLAVQQFWLRLFSRQPKDKLSDEQLAKAVKAEFPMGKDYSTKDIQVHRAMYNRGVLPGQLKENNGKTIKPATRIAQYVDGEAQPFWGERAKARTTKKARNEGTELEGFAETAKAKPRVKAKAKVVAKKATKSKASKK